MAEYDDGGALNDDGRDYAEEEWQRAEAEREGAEELADWERELLERTDTENLTPEQAETLTAGWAEEALAEDEALAAEQAEDDHREVTVAEYFDGNGNPVCGDEYCPGPRECHACDHLRFMDRMRAESLDPEPIAEAMDPESIARETGEPASARSLAVQLLESGDWAGYREWVAEHEQ